MSACLDLNTCTDNNGAEIDMDEGEPTLMIREEASHHNINNLHMAEHHRHSTDETNHMLHQQWDEMTMLVSSTTSSNECYLLRY